MSAFTKRCPGCIAIIPNRTTMCECCAGKARARAVAMAGPKVVRDQLSEASPRSWRDRVIGGGKVRFGAGQRSAHVPMIEGDADYAVSACFMGDSQGDDNTCVRISGISWDGFTVLVTPHGGGTVHWEAIREVADIDACKPAKPAPKVGDRVRVRIESWENDAVGVLHASDAYDFSLHIYDGLDAGCTPGIYAREILEVLP